MQHQDIQLHCQKQLNTRSLSLTALYYLIALLSHPLMIQVLNYHHTLSHVDCTHTSGQQTKAEQSTEISKCRGFEYNTCVCKMANG